ncbi:ShKT domain-containing protein [Caenorhabditis elegans]|uniref:ShKT domain-containing protein n=1 Tax=Caenorhabditis elegans TaxID=6239 RepID=Q22714_CAEEL|nr:ShKT domain-containing protein [Caenorhabditis elegans]CAA92755.2 ShKT domain-containing protein [Caenorhabditis elegans]|eukprot:NP_495937.2 Uncharacterized protein CELE_T24B8.5 [Caenorhabditis elegans]
MRYLIGFVIVLVAYTASESCVDSRPSCPSLKNYCNEADVRSGCRKTCGVCVTDTPFVCEDKLGLCPNYVRQCHDENIAEQCPKTCQICGTTAQPMQKSA